MSDPALDPQAKAALVKRLMDARRAVKDAKRSGDEAAEAAAHRMVDETKRELGERGPVWWNDETPDLTRHAVKNTPYAAWHSKLSRNG